jgi:hypothetical protein
MPNEGWPTRSLAAGFATAGEATVVNDWEGDFYANWAVTPAENVHLLTQMMHDHALLKGGTVRTAMARQPLAAEAACQPPPYGPSLAALRFADAQSLGKHD